MFTPFAFEVAVNVSPVTRGLVMNASKKVTFSISRKGKDLFERADTESLCSDESTRLPPMWVEFVSSQLCCERIFPGDSGFPSSQNMTRI